MKQTANYNLNKPDATDVVDIEYLSANMDIVDSELYKSLKNDVTVTIAQGGTGAKTVGDARTNLGLGAAATKAVDTLPTASSGNLITSGAVKSAIDGKSNISHTHDDIYYTESEMNNKLASKSDTGHTHTASQVTGLPTSLPANGGNADTVDGFHVNLANATWGLKPIYADTWDMISGTTQLSQGNIYMVYE